MKRRKYVWFSEAGCVPYLRYHGDGATGRQAKCASLEALADLCDRDAENRNAHDYCGVHEKLADVLTNHVGEKMAFEIMHDIAQRGGLQGMNGICQHDGE